MNKVKHNKSWLVQLSINTKQKLVELVKGCMITIDGMETSVDLNILPLGSFDILIGMNWLENHVAVVNCKNKTFHFLDELG